MKHDKHKAKRSAKYRKQHGISSGSETKSGKLTPTKTDHGQRPRQRGSAVNSADTLGTSAKEDGGILTLASPKSAASILIEKDQERQKAYSRRKIISNWDKYDDFAVDDEGETEVFTEARGEDFQKLLLKPGDASSQLRMKDEVWWDGDDEPDEAETEIGKLFKIDFAEVSHRLEAIPLHMRLGISTKYFDEDLLKKINEDAAQHAMRYQEILDAETVHEQDTASSSNHVSSAHTTRGFSESTPSTAKRNCEFNRPQGSGNKDNYEHKHLKDETLCIDNERQHIERHLEESESQVSDRTPDVTVDESSSGHPNMDTGTPEASATSCTSTALPSVVGDTSIKQQTKPSEEEDLEDWLDDILDE